VPAKLRLDPDLAVGNRSWETTFAGAYAPILGDPSPAGQPIETIAFRATG
jgi:hypothetical protein